MSVWERYSKEQREQYILFLQVYGALTKLNYLLFTVKQHLLCGGFVYPKETVYDS